MQSENDFGLYKLLVHEVRETRRARRQLANLLITLNLAGASALGFLANADTRLSPALAAWLIVALILTCLVWRVSNSYYTHLLSVKYDIIYECERSLGYDALQREWKGLSRRGPVKWFGLERLMPLLFIGGYIVFLSYQITTTDVQGGLETISQCWDQLVQIMTSL